MQFELRAYSSFFSRMLIDRGDWNAIGEKLTQYRHLFENKPSERFFPLFVRMADERRAIFLTIVPSPTPCTRGKKSCSLPRIIPNKVSPRLSSPKIPLFFQDFAAQQAIIKIIDSLPVPSQDWYSRDSSRRELAINLEKIALYRYCEEERKKRGLLFARRSCCIDQALATCNWFDMKRE